VAWQIGDKLAAAGVVIAALGIVTGAFAAIDPQEAGCLVHLRSCPSTSGAQTSANGSPSAAVSGLAPSSAPPDILPGSDPSLPYPLVTPPIYPATGKLTIRVNPDSVMNRGTSVVIMVTGSGFTRNGTLSISLYNPEGGTFLGGSGYPVDVDGDFRQAFLWHPIRGYGDSGNDGTWRWTIQDQTTGKTITSSLKVSSNASTPPEDQWPVSYNLPSSGPAAVRVTTYGNLCTRAGELTQTRISGFAPAETFTLYYLLPDGRAVISIGEIADALGEVETAETYWRIKDCRPDHKYRFSVLVQDSTTGRSARTAVVLSTG
jgi:hypothetical protein